MQIIRIEHEDGWGLFRTNTDRPNASGLGLNVLVRRHCDNFPTPYRETGEDIKYYEFCAFKTIEQVQKWITPREMQIILENNFKVWLLDVSDCKVCEYQCIFRKESIIQKKDISSLFKTKVYAKNNKKAKTNSRRTYSRKASKKV